MYTTTPDGHQVYTTRGLEFLLWRRARQMERQQRAGRPQTPPDAPARQPGRGPAPAGPSAGGAPDR